LATPQNIQEYL